MGVFIKRWVWLVKIIRRYIDFLILILLLLVLLLFPHNY